MYKVSVLVPIYGVEKYIKRCAKSIFEQSYQNLDIVFVDDCSPDMSIDILKDVLSKYPERKEQVRIVRHVKNRGLSAARNTAVDASDGDFVIHVDSDDYLAKDAISKLIQAQKLTDADIITGSAVKLTPFGQEQLDSIKYNSHFEMTKDMCSLTLRHTVWARLIRKRLYSDHDIHAKEGVDIGEDLQVMPQLAYYAQKVDSVKDVVYYYDCTNDSSYTNTDSKVSVKKKEIKLLQDVESAKLLNRFFADKEPLFLKFTENNVKTIYGDLLLLYIRNCKKREFMEMAKYYKLEKGKSLHNSKRFVLFNLVGFNYTLCRFINTLIG